MSHAMRLAGDWQRAVVMAGDQLILAESASESNRCRHFGWRQAFAAAEKSAAGWLARYSELVGWPTQHALGCELAHTARSVTRADPHSTQHAVGCPTHSRGSVGWRTGSRKEGRLAHQLAQGARASVLAAGHCVSWRSGRKECSKLAGALFRAGGLAHTTGKLGCGPALAHTARSVTRAGPHSRCVS